MTALSPRFAQFSTPKKPRTNSDEPTTFFDYFTVDQLSVDPEVQRSLDMLWVRNTAQGETTEAFGAFDAEALGTLLCCRRGDGSLAVVDGQHRKALCEYVGHTMPVHCEVKTGLDKSQEAALFRKHNKRRAVQPLDSFRIRVVEGDPAAVKIKGVLEAHGWIIRTSKSSHSFAAVSAAEEVYRGFARGRKQANLGTLESVISIITEAWGHNADGVTRPIVLGLGKVIDRHGQRVDIVKLVQVLATYTGGPRVLYSDAKQLRDVSSGISLGDAMASKLVRLVNKGRSRNKLPEWMDYMPEDGADDE